MFGVQLLDNVKLPFSFGDQQVVHLRYDSVQCAGLIVRLKVLGCAYNIGCPVEGAGWYEYVVADCDGLGMLCGYAVSMDAGLKGFSIGVPNRFVVYGDAVSGFVAYVGKNLYCMDVKLAGIAFGFAWLDVVSSSLSSVYVSFVGVAS